MSPGPWICPSGPVLNTVRPWPMVRRGGPTVISSDMEAPTVPKAAR